MQDWPVLRILAIIAPSSAASRSASSSTMKGALPPSSIEQLMTFSAAWASRMRPTSVEPVKESLRTRWSFSIALTTSDERFEGMTLTTPFGTPACSSRSATASAVSGVSVMFGGVCDAGDYLGGGGVGHVDSLLIGRRPPAAVDVQVGMPDGDQLTDRGHHIDFLTVSTIRWADGMAASSRTSAAGS